ncbi:MAG TPA: MarR family transcriptional regulator [Bryobacteraceae bacterium]|nr:MarR family transcriptional regulator [Bryobacteraceae bacterium]
MPVPETTADPLLNTAINSREVMNAIRRIIHALQVSSHASQKSIGISGAQLFLLQILAAGDVMSVNELASRSCTHQSSVSVVARRLVEAKLVKRAASATDARRLDLSVTAAGRRVLKSQVATPQQRIITALARLGPLRLFELRLLLEEVIAESGFDSGPTPMFFEGKAQGSPPEDPKGRQPAKVFSKRSKLRKKTSHK